MSEFYISRYARLWPQYAAIAAATLALSFAVPTPKSELFFKAFNNLNLGEKLLLGFSNASLLGQDWLMFARIANGSFSFISNFREAAIPAYYGLLLPQSWTLGVELTFYVIAPFILPRKWLMATLLAISVLIRIVLVNYGLGSIDPWTYRFFPAELALFLIGAFIQQLVLPVYRQVASLKWDMSITAGVVLILCLYPVLAINDVIKSLFLITCCAFALPALFRFQHGRPLDVSIGDLSYPIYINHVLVIAVVHRLGFASGSIALALAAATLSAAVAIGMNYFIGRPVERWRSALKRRAAASDTSRHSALGNLKVR